MTTKPLTLTQQKVFLRALGLPYKYAWQRSASFKKFQRASCWHDFGSAASKAAGPLVQDGKCGVKTSAHARDSMRHAYRIAPHFTLAEFACGCGGRRLGCKWVDISRNLVRRLENLREAHYQGGMEIVSGYRCKGHNRAVGGIRTSAHPDGTASDVRGRVKAKQLRNLGFRGIGVSKVTGLVIHLDLDPSLPTDYVFYE